MADLVEAVIEDARWGELNIAGLAEKACAETLAQLGLARAQYEISLLACDDARIAVLNSDFRDKPTPTNVLSWPDEDLSPDMEGGAPHPAQAPRDGEPVALGDIAIAFETCMAEAAAQDKAQADHVTHLLVHGCLHLLGYDHISDKDAALMEGLEVKILAKLGIADPY